MKKLILVAFFISRTAYSQITGKFLGFDYQEKETILKICLTNSSNQKICLPNIFSIENEGINSDFFNDTISGFSVLLYYALDSQSMCFNKRSHCDNCQISQYPSIVSDSWQVYLGRIYGMYAPRKVRSLREVTLDYFKDFLTINPGEDVTISLWHNTLFLIRLHENGIDLSKVWIRILINQFNDASFYNSPPVYEIFRGRITVDIPPGSINIPKKFMRRYRRIVSGLPEVEKYKITKW